MRGKQEQDGESSEHGGGAARGSERGEAAWLLVLAGWLVARAALVAAGPRADAGELELFPTPTSAPLPPLVDSLRAGSTAIDLERSPPRVLRRLPGIGRRRAVDLARARWEGGDDEPLELRSIHGIGPKTEARVLARLAEQEAKEEQDD